MKKLIDRLEELSDKEYAAFQAKLTPNVDAELFIGVRVPVLRKFAKDYAKEAEHIEFMNELPHKYYDENMLHGLLIEQIKDYDECISAIEKFLPYVDNWAVCDIMSPKVLGKHKSELLPKLCEWAASEKTYTCRFGLEMLMSHFLDQDFKPEYLEVAQAVRSEEYYVKMMVAWFFATALAKQWEATIPHIEAKKLETWTHNKAIQKSIESRRITDEQKKYLRSLKISK